MQRFKNILVATDTRYEKHPIIDEAAVLAEQNNAVLKIVDVVPDFSWTVRLTLKDHDHVRELIVEEKEHKLNDLADPIRKKGIPVSVGVLRGKTSIQIIREVLRNQHDLVIRVAKGTDSRRPGFFGTTAMRLFRECPCAVLLVSTSGAPRFSHVAGCVDTSSGDARDEELNAQIYELASTISQYHGGRFSILHAWSIWNDQFLKNRMTSEEFHQLEEKTHDEAQGLFDTFLRKHGSTAEEDNMHLIRGEPTSWIPKFVTDNQVDLVVMGTVARSGVSGVIMGNTAEQVLNDLQCSVLAVKPNEFVSPITLE